MGRDSDGKSEDSRGRDRGPRREGGPPKRGKRGKRRGRVCHYVDYKDVPSLRRNMSAHGKIYSRKRGANCSKCQRLTTQAIKRARFMGLLSYTN